ncbi:MAG: hypothetical protein ACRECX_14855 [Methyloceanibacter sp.]|uniref:hypothetical protein n=1 Tax=Methyloceanibacter sp. TaxID=1965321 RepID=UPI003D6D85A4
MASLDAGRAVTRALHRVRWALHSHLLETKLHALRCKVRAKFDPNQPRVPAGNPDGGQWTDGGGGSSTSGSASSDTLVGGSGRLGRGGRGSGYVTLRDGRRAPATLQQEVQHAVLNARAARLRDKVRELDAKWRPTPSFTETVQGEIDAARAEIREADAYLRELSFKGIGPGPFAGESISARGSSRDFRVDERREVNRIGSETGCHTCGGYAPGTPSGNFIPDHQPPTALNSTGRPQRLYPQCLPCSLKQGGWITGRGSRK